MRVRVRARDKFNVRVRASVRVSVRLTLTLTPLCFLWFSWNAHMVSTGQLACLRNENIQKKAKYTYIKPGLAHSDRHTGAGITSRI